MKALALALALLLAGPAAAELRVLVVGDSISFGIGTGDLTLAWPELVRRAGYDVRNTSCVAADSCDAVSFGAPDGLCFQGSYLRQRILPQAFWVQVTVAMLGTNDALFATCGQYQENMRKLSDWLPGPMIYVVPPPNLARRGATGKLRQYRLALLEIAATDPWVEVVDLFDALNSPEFFDCESRRECFNVHLNAEAHRLIGKAVIALLEGL